MPNSIEEGPRTGQLPGVCLHCQIGEYVQELIRCGYKPSRALFDVMQFASEMAKHIGEYLSEEDRKELLQYLHASLDQQIDRTKPVPFLDAVPTRFN
jgi:hypothetical protein